MAAPADVKLRNVSAAPAAESVVTQLVEQHNNLVEAVRIIAAQLDLDATVTDTDYFANSLDEAIATAPKKIDAV